MWNSNLTIKNNFFNFFSKRQTSRKIVNYYDKKKTKQATSIALNYFDLNYNKIFGNQWRSIRLGLISPNKHVAVLNSFSNLDETINDMKLQKAIDLSSYYNRYARKVEKEKIRHLSLKKEKINKKILDNNETDSENVSNFSEDESNLTSSTASDAKYLFSSNENDEERFLNQSSSSLDLKTFVPTTEFISHENLIESKDLFLDDNFEINFIEEPYLEFPTELKIYINKRGVLSYLKIDEDELEEENLNNEEDDDEKKEKLDYYGDEVKLKKQYYNKYNKMIFSFPHPKLHEKIFNYFLMDAASILPVLCMNIQPGDSVADYCSAPGGKALSIILTKRPNKLMLNDNSESRLFRLNNVLKSYVSNRKLLNNIDIRQQDASTIIEEETYDKILVDAPCLNDRTCVLSNENNIFKSSRLKERMNLPKIQNNILIAALKSLKLNGNAVYSTCTLHPSQNDFVVHLALQTVEQSTNKKFLICNLKESLRPLKGLYKMFSNKYGTLILPYVPNNCGPMYICKIKRIQ